MICTLFKVQQSQIHGRGLFAGVDLLPGLMVPVVAHEVDADSVSRKTIYVDDMLLEPYHPFAFLNQAQYVRGFKDFCGVKRNMTTGKNPEIFHAGSFYYLF